MEKLQAILSKGLAGAEEANAFATIQNQPHARSLVGLLIAQGQSFARAKQARKQLYAYLAEQKVDTGSDDATWTALFSISEEQWLGWGVSKTVGMALSMLKTEIKKQSLCSIIEASESKKQQYRIGPWTRKAFWIMTASDRPEETKAPSVLLTEDSWVRQRWGLVLHHMKLKEDDYPLTLETCQKLEIHPIQLSRLLWRLTKDGVCRLVQSKSKIDKASEWFIPSI